MSQTLAQIAETLKANDKKVQLIYAFNGSGKTRLSREFKELIAPKQPSREDQDGDQDEDQPARNKFLYYNAFTEDLFYWDNDLKDDTERKLIIQPNDYTQWALVRQGQDQNAIGHFQRYTNDKLTPRFNQEYKATDEDGKERTIPAFSEITFSFERGDNQQDDNIKISKGEESNFIWSIFYAVLEEVIGVLNVAEESDRDTDQFNELEYIFIDDPVSSLDDNHLIELAADLATMIKFNRSDIRFIISTHNPLFFNLLCNEFCRSNRRSVWRDGEFVQLKWKQHWATGYQLEKLEDGGHSLVTQPADSPFAYHLHLLSRLGEVVASGQVEKYHFNLLRNILEKTAVFLGYKNWEDLLPKVEDGGPNPYAKRIINFASHSKHSGEESAFLETRDKKMLGVVVEHVLAQHRFWTDGAQDA